MFALAIQCCKPRLDLEIARRVCRCSSIPHPSLLFKLLDCFSRDTVEASSEYVGIVRSCGHIERHSTSSSQSTASDDVIAVHVNLQHHVLLTSSSPIDIRIILLEKAGAIPHLGISFSTHGSYPLLSLFTHFPPSPSSNSNTHTLSLSLPHLTSCFGMLYFVTPDSILLTSMSTCWLIIYLSKWLHFQMTTTPTRLQARLLQCLRNTCET